MTEQLLEAIKEGKPWLDNFTRYNYREAFRKYCDKYEMLYRAALHNSSSPNDLAQKIVQGIEDGWKKGAHLESRCRPGQRQDDGDRLSYSHAVGLRRRSVSRTGRGHMSVLVSALAGKYLSNGFL